MLLPLSRDGSGFFVLKHEIDLFYVRFLKQLLGVRVTVPHAIVLHEVRRLPCTAFVWQRIVSWWNRMVDMPCDDLVKKAFIANCQLPSNRASPTWSYEVMSKYTGFAGLSFDRQTWHTTHLSPLPSTLGGFMGDYVARYRVPDLQLSDKSVDIRLYTYFSCFFSGYGQGAKDCLPRYLAVSYNAHGVSLARFRLGSHWLRVETMRWPGQFAPRSGRVCRACHSCVEDEYHIFVCPEMQVLCEQFSTLLCSSDLPPRVSRPADWMVALFDRTSPAELSRFLAAVGQHFDAAIC
jgi:hypothetical protein